MTLKWKTAVLYCLTAKKASGNCASQTCDAVHQLKTPPNQSMQFIGPCVSADFKPMCKGARERFLKLGEQHFSRMFIYTESPYYFTNKFKVINVYCSQVPIDEHTPYMRGSAAGWAMDHLKFCLGGPQYIWPIQ